jgi:folate-dependent phosphoribosylglycinamide formyltransferase PurN
MSIVFMTGSHPRHLYMACAVARSKNLKGVIVEEREEHIPTPPQGLAGPTRALFERHFRDRSDSEARFFASARAPAELQGVETMRVSLEELNGPKTWAFIDRLQPEILLSYGVHKLTQETLHHAKGHSWNVHGGLSPWYRGVITHFWPSYMLEPQMTGMTVHETTVAIDGGDIVHQTVADLVRGDRVHDLACRAVAALAAEIPDLLARTFDGRLKPLVRQKTTGRIWRAADWRPAHLHLVYDYYGNRVVDRFLDGEFGSDAPRLVRQF